MAVTVPGVGIRTPDQRLRVFVSSTLAELADERQAVRRAISALRLTPVMFELGARPHPPQDVYRAYLAQSDVFIGLYWQQYGWVGPGMVISGLEDEFELSRSLPRLLYVKVPAPDRESRLATMLARIEDEATESYRRFHSARELNRIVREDLATLLSERFAGSLRSEADSPPPDPVPRSAAKEIRPGWRPNLPIPDDSFIGRNAEAERLKRLLARSRLVTVTGPGGSGKTRLAMEVARAIEATGVPAAFVDCAPIVDARQIPDRLAVALCARLHVGEATIDALVGATRLTPAIAVLDNLEHLPHAAATVVELLGAVEHLRILATSRNPLHARGEHLLSLRPLAVDPESADRVSPAVELFSDRASAIDTTFALTTEREGQVRAICRRLDGLPLAIELAATRLRLLPIEALLARLDRALNVLESDPGDRPFRHRALRATIQSSYQLLPERVQVRFRAWGVFRGGWDFAAAAAVAAAADELDVLRDCDALLDAALIERVTTDDQPRFRMLETLREFAEEQLDLENEVKATRNRHARYFLEVAQEACLHLTDRSRDHWLDRLESDRDNLASAFSWLAEHDEVAVAARAAAALWRFWQARGHLAEGRAIIGSLLERISDTDDTILQADLLTALGNLAYWQREWPTAKQFYTEALTRYDKTRQALGIADSHYNLGFISIFNDRSLEQARDEFTKAHAAYRLAENPDGVANARAGLALVDRMTGSYHSGLRRARRSLTEQRSRGNDVDADNTLGLLGSIEACTGNLDEADPLLRQALEAFSGSGNIYGIVWMLYELAALAAVRGSSARAVRLSSAARTLDTRAGGGVAPEQLGLLRLIDRAAEQLTPAAVAEARHSGEQLTVEEAVASALAIPYGVAEA